MPQLVLTFRRGFQDDHVVVELNGARVLDRTGLTTRPETGSATTLRHRLAAGRVELEVKVVTRGVTRQAVIELRGDAGVSVDVTEQGEVDVKLQQAGGGPANG